MTDTPTQQEIDALREIAQYECRECGMSWHLRKAVRWLEALLRREHGDA